MRSKRTAFMLILGPLLVILLIGLAFNNSSGYHLRIGTYSDSYSNMSEGITSSLKGDGYELFEQGSQEECIESVKAGMSHVCLVFSSNLSVDSSMNNSITAFVDYSQFNLAWTVLKRISEKISMTSDAVTKGLAERLLESLQRSSQELDEQEKRLSTLSGKQKDIASSIETIRYHLDSQNFSLDTDSFETGEIDDAREDLEEKRSGLVRKMTHALNEIEGEVDDYNLSESEKNKTFDIIRETRDGVELMDKVMEGKSDSIGDRVDDFEENLDELAQMLKHNKANRDSAYPELDAVSTARQDSLKTIMELKSSLDDLREEYSRIVVTDAGDIASPIDTAVEPVTSQRTHFNYLFPSLVVLLAMFVSVLLASTLVVAEKNSKAFVRNIITPIRDAVFVISTYLTSLILIMMQLTVVFAVSYYFIPHEFTSSIFLIFVVLFLVATLFILLGMAMGYLFTKQDAAIIASFSLATIFMLFSGFVLPLESMPDSFRALAMYNPFVMAESLVRKVLFFDFGFAALQHPLLMLGGYCAVLLTFILLLHAVVKRQYAMPMRVGKGGAKKGQKSAGKK